MISIAADIVEHTPEGTLFDITGCGKNQIGVRVEKEGRGVEVVAKIDCKCFCASGEVMMGNSVGFGDVDGDETEMVLHDCLNRIIIDSELSHCITIAASGFVQPDKKMAFLLGCFSCKLIQIDFFGQQPRSQCGTEK